MLKYLICMLQLILSPGRGWEDISYEKINPQRLTSRCFFPFLAIVALTYLVRLLYEPTLTIVGAVIHVAMIFVVFFVSFFIAMFVMGLKVTDYVEGNYNEKRTTTFVIYLQSLVALIKMFENILPVDIGLVFFSIYIVIIAWKACRYMAVTADKEFYFVMLTIVAVIAPSYLLSWLFNLVI